MVQLFRKRYTRINLTDETVLINGQNPPCRNCQVAMRKATANNNATINYLSMERKWCSKTSNLEEK